MAKPFAALVTFERLLFGVDVSVVTKVVLPPESLSANITVEGSLVGVGPLMDEEVVRLVNSRLQYLQMKRFFGLEALPGPLSNRGS